MWGPKEGLTVKMDACVKTKPPTSKGRINASARQSVRYRMQDRGIRSTLGGRKGGRDRRARRVEPVWPGCLGGRAWVGKLGGGWGLNGTVHSPVSYSKSPYSPHIQAVMPLYSPCRLAAVPYNAASVVRSVPCFPVCPSVGPTQLHGSSLLADLPPHVDHGQVYKYTGIG